MRWSEIIFEGKVYQMEQRYGVSGERIFVYSNPTTEQVKALITSAMNEHPDHSFYLRGICYMNKRMMLCNGWKLTHDDLMHDFFPRGELHESEYTTFEVDAHGIRIVKQGDYDVFATRWAASIIRAFAQPE